MKILAVDTASKSCSTAVVSGQTLLAEITQVTDETHSRHLLGMIERAVALSGLTSKELDAYAVTIGPGSFTGLRIGMSTVKGLAAASDKPVAGISSLDALANGFSFSSRQVCTMLDARRGEVYFSAYMFQGGRMIKKEAEQAISPLEAVADMDAPSLFVGDGAMAHKKTIQNKIGDLAHFVPDFQNHIKASSVAWLGLEKMRQSRIDPEEVLVPRYLRKSDAEAALKKRMSKSNNEL